MCIRDRYNSAQMTLEQVLDVMRAAQDENKDVVRLHTGDPLSLIHISCRWHGDDGPYRR